MLEEDNDSKEVQDIKQDIFGLFDDLTFDSDISKSFNDYDENFDILYFTAMFFFNYLIEQKGKNKEINGEKYDSFIKKARDLIDTEGYASGIVSYKYEIGNFD